MFRYALRRMPILPALYDPSYDALRADPGDNPYEQARAFTYHPSWTGPVFRAMAYAVRVTCVDVHDELRAAYGALVAAKFPPRATARFDDVSLVDYETAASVLRRAAQSSDPLDEAAVTERITSAIRAQYAEVVELARAGR